MTTPDAHARADIDQRHEAADWQDCNAKDSSGRAARGVAIREFPLAEGHGEADYLLHIDEKAVGVIEAKKRGTTPRASSGSPRVCRRGCGRCPSLYEYRRMSIDSRIGDYGNGLSGFSLRTQPADRRL